jgi:hypothetical protein
MFNLKASNGPSSTQFSIKPTQANIALDFPDETESPVLTSESSKQKATCVLETYGDCCFSEGMVKCCFPNQIVDGYCFSPQPKY